MSSRAPKPEERAQTLAAARRLKMARSAHAYVRGNTEKFYAWLESAFDRDLPQGPPVWICGLWRTRATLGLHEATLAEQLTVPFNTLHAWGAVCSLLRPSGEHWSRDGSRSSARCRVPTAGSAAVADPPPPRRVP
jgi:hypothetical protein